MVEFVLFTVFVLAIQVVLSDQACGMARGMWRAVWGMDDQ